MNRSDEEIELLDRYLDNDLSEAELVGVEARIANDPELAAELARLREHRALRVEAFASMEATDLEAQQLQWYIRGAMHQQEKAGREAMRITDRLGFGGWVGGLTRVAAVLVLGVVVGYAIRGPSQPLGSGPVAGGPVGYVPGAAAGDAAGSRPVLIGNTPAEANFAVNVMDPFGNVVAVQKFRTMQEAREFADELNRMQQRQRQLKNTGVRLIGDDF